MFGMRVKGIAARGMALAATNTTLEGRGRSGCGWQRDHVGVDSIVGPGNPLYMVQSDTVRGPIEQKTGQTTVKGGLGHRIHPVYVRKSSLSGINPLRLHRINRCVRTPAWSGRLWRTMCYHMQDLRASGTGRNTAQMRDFERVVADDHPAGGGDAGVRSHGVGPCCRMRSGTHPLPRHDQSGAPNRDDLR